MTTCPSILRRRPLVAVTVLVALSMASCTGDSSTEPPATEPVATDPPATEPVATDPPTTEPPATEPPATEPPTTEPSATAPLATDPPGTEPPATEPCDAPTGSVTVEDGFPFQMSSLVGSDIRTGEHPCFERVVLELQGEGELPGYRVEYVPDPVRLSPSDLPVELAGDATLVLSVASWMTDTEGNGYQGPTQFFPTGLTHIMELLLIENFEGLHAWAIGIDEQRDFTVTTLTEPPRIVIDVASS